MPELLELPFSKGPEKIFEQEEERRPRMYAKDIYLQYPEEERLQQVDRLVPQHFRDMVRHYLKDAAVREKAFRERG